MNCKVDNILKAIDVNHRVVLKMDRASGLAQLTITDGKGFYVIGTHPGGKLRRVNSADLRAMLIENSIYINSWSA